jgi:hypothetical protein
MTKDELLELADRLRATTEQMANWASVDMGLWNLHSNACLEAAEALRARASTPTQGEG